MTPNARVCWDTKQPPTMANVPKWPLRSLQVGRLVEGEAAGLGHTQGWGAGINLRDEKESGHT